MKYYKDTVLLDTQTVPVNSVEVFVSSSLAIDCTKIEVSFLSGLPYRRMRVSKVYYRETDFTLDFSSIAENSQAISKIDELKAVTVPGTLTLPVTAPPIFTRKRPPKLNFMLSSLVLHKIFRSMCLAERWYLPTFTPELRTWCYPPAPKP